MNSELRIDLPIMPTDTQYEASIFAELLLAELQDQPGLEELYVVENVRMQSDGADATYQLCVQHDSETLPIERIHELLKAACVRISERFVHLTWNIDGIVDEHGARMIAEQLRAIPGVLDANAGADGVVQLEFDSRQTSETDIRATMEDVGARFMSK